MRHTVHLLLLHPTDASVLALKRDARFALPSVNVGSAWLGMSGPLNDAVLDSLDADAFVLRTWLLRLGRRRSDVESAALMRLRSPVWTPPAGSRWLAADDVAALPARMRAAVVDAITDRDVPHRAAWTRRGWYDEAAAWAIHALLDAGYRIDGAMEQVRHWSLSSIWRIPTKSGSTLFKAVPPMFAYEGALMRAVRRRTPAAVPAVIALDRERGWTLMEEVPGTLLRDAERPRRADALRTLAAIQKACIGREHELLDAGCADRRLAALPGAASAMISRRDVRSALADPELLDLEALLAGLPKQIEALMSCGLPETLVHGDFHHGNVIDTGDRLVLIDWTDGCVSHPFFDLATFLDEAKEETYPALRDAYLAEWADIVPPQKLEQAALLARPLACWHHAVSYQRIIDEIEPSARAEIGPGPEAWLRRLLSIAGKSPAAKD